MCCLVCVCLGVVRSVCVYILLYVCGKICVSMLLSVSMYMCGKICVYMLPCLCVVWFVCVYVW